ncbi:MAG TPA: DapH/DapD/GlmU-related protein [Clostridia bacterium]|jgi:bifunctional UDP-N-acetylglucosamine pyrophosphorylase/glucosamine-1-phosphate N-acetyltransferase|nr:DapH/DapD/GlmU-related protein [Clostridia bacterium]
MEEIKLGYYFKNIDGFTFKEVFDNCITPFDALKNIDKFFDEKIIKNDVRINKANTSDFVSITGNYFIDEGTHIHANVVIEGPVMIGKNVTIQSGALIRPGSIIGDNCVVGHCCEVKHSIVQNKAKVQSFTFIGDSIIGKSTRVGSGAILANRRFDQQNINVKINGEIIDSQTDFFGSILGDNTRLGANSTAAPGTFVGPYCWILPTVQIRGFIPAEKRVYPTTGIRIEENPRIDLK